MAHRPAGYLRTNLALGRAIKLAHAGKGRAALRRLNRSAPTTIELFRMACLLARIVTDRAADAPRTRTDDVVAELTAAGIDVDSLIAPELVDAKADVLGFVRAVVYMDDYEGALLLFRRGDGRAAAYILLLLMQLAALELGYRAYDSAT